MKNIIATCILLLLITSCKKSTTAPVPKPDSLIFGRYNPMCMTPNTCGQFYLLQNNMLFADQSYYMTPNPFALAKEPDSLYAIAKQLIDNFPTYLLNHPNDSLIGCPGCADGAVIRLWATTNDVRTKWDVNADTSQIPVGLRLYIWQVNNVLDQL
ncbi:MAG: hypothetical protein P4L41_03725 [Flavipsychrobacter sp.]|nr:hypothetical protein [Flavipsychrobacter sp.]